MILPRQAKISKRSTSYQCEQVERNLTLQAFKIFRPRHNNTVRSKDTCECRKPLFA